MHVLKLFCLNMIIIYDVTHDLVYGPIQPKNGWLTGRMGNIKHKKITFRITFATSYTAGYVAQMVQ